MQSLKCYNETIVLLLEDLKKQRSKIKSSIYKEFLRTLHIYEKNDLEKTVEKYLIVYHDYSYEKQSEKKLLYSIAYKDISSLNEFFQMLTNSINDYEKYEDNFESCARQIIYSEMEKIITNHHDKIIQAINQIEPSLLEKDNFNLYDIDNKLKSLNNIPLLSQNLLLLMNEIKEETQSLNFIDLLNFEIYEEKKYLENRLSNNKNEEEKKLNKI
jgi:hypothetical protein